MYIFCQSKNILLEYFKKLIYIVDMRILEAFRLKKNYSYVKLYDYLKSKGITASKIAIYSWCKEDEKARYPKGEIIEELSRITKIPIREFWHDTRKKEQKLVSTSAVINGE